MRECRAATKEPKNDEKGGSVSVAVIKYPTEKEFQLVAEVLSRATADWMERVLVLAVAKRQERAISGRNQGTLVSTDEMREVNDIIERQRNGLVDATVKVVGREKAGEIVAEYGQTCPEARPRRVVA